MKSSGVDPADAADRRGPTATRVAGEMDRRVQRCIQAALQQASCGVALFIIDVPGLLEIAETYGDPARRALLRHIEERLRERFGAEAVARATASQFSLVLQGVLEPDVPTIVQRIQAATGGRQGASINGVALVEPPAIGVALTGARDGRTRTGPTELAELVRHAELALQQAWLGPSGAYRIYSVALDAALRDRTLLRQALLRAIDRQEFRLAYQPIVDLQAQVTTGLEALIRWQTPPLGISADPTVFITAAEETGLIIPIGAQVLEAAALQIRRWSHRGFPPPRVAVNVSALQLREPGFIDTVLRTLERSGLPPACLELELTERILVDSSLTTIRMMERMQELGIDFVVDDFGTGYSSLRYLQELPVSKLKIDRSFITNIGEGGRQVALVDAMLGMATNLGLKVVAEGIETPEQFRVLRSRGCQSGQGFIFSHAMRAEEAHHCFQQHWAVN